MEQVINDLKTAIESLSTNLPKPKMKKIGGVNTEVADPTSLAVTAVLAAVSALSGFLQQQGGAAGGGGGGAHEERLRGTEDELDETRQRALKGNFLMKDQWRREFHEGMIHDKVGQSENSHSSISHQ